ncbi:MAG: AMP-binding protein [Gammaproteobacteria bacterium]|nr:AMP-binding protein [Gammaproteobacteria bacterium]
MDKIWLNNYPKDVPHEISLDHYGSLNEFLSDAFSRYQSLPAIEFLGKRISYGELDRMTDQMAGYYRDTLKLAVGDRIAIMLPNCLQHPVSMIGAIKAGLTVVNINPLYTPRELNHALKDSGAKAIVVLENFANTVNDAKAGTALESVILTELGDLIGLKGKVVNFVLRYVKKMVPAHTLKGHRIKDALAKGGDLQEVARSHDDIAFLQYTGGTTGVSKGVMLTHRNILANLEQAYVWLLSAGAEVGSERIITALPLYHIFALTANCFTYMRMGALAVLVPNARDIPALVKTFQAFKPTAFTGVNTLFNALLNNPDFAKCDFSSLKLTLSGGMAAQESVANRWKQVTGVTLLEAYGLTETSPAVCINRMDETEFNGTVGLPLSSTEVCVRDDNGNECPIGEPGELCVRGPQVMKGYWQRPDATAEVLDADGWFATGDVAVIDELGRVKIVDRIKDMVLVSGFNVYPNEVEEQIAAHPGVLEAGVIGEPSEVTGEAVVAVVVKSDPSVSDEDLRQWCKERLTNYKRPTRYVFKDELPKTNVGKILRRELRDLI